MRPWAIPLTMALASGPPLLSAQDLPPITTIRPHGSIAGDVAELTGVEGVSLALDGTLVLGDADGLRVLSFPADLSRPTIIGRSGEGPGEFRNIREAGFVGNRIWVSDGRLRRLQVFMQDGTLADVRPTPWTTGGGAGSRVTMFPVGVLAPDSLIGRATVQRADSRDWTSGKREGDQALIVTDREGTVARVLAWGGPILQCKKTVRALPLPRTFCTPPLLDVSPESRFAISIQDVSADGPRAMLVVTTVDVVRRRARTDTLRFPRARIDDSRRAAAAAEVRTRLGAAPGAKEMSTEMTSDPYPPAFLGAVASDDMTAWIHLSEGERSGSIWLHVGAEGQLLERVALPQGAEIIAARDKAIWTRSSLDGGWLDLRRYRLIR